MQRGGAAWRRGGLLLALASLMAAFVLRRHFIGRSVVAAAAGERRPVYDPPSQAPLPRPAEPTPQITFGLFYAGAFTECVPSYTSGPT